MASQAEMYLHRALDEFHRACNAPDLWIPVDPFHRGSVLEESQQVLNAKNRRLQFLRSSILFSAISAEAFANELINELLGAADVDALDKLGTPEKLLLGVPLATGNQSILTRGAHPMQGVSALIKTRNRLVHPRPQGGIAAWVQDVLPKDEEVIGPKAAQDGILAVADLVVLCTPLREHPNLHGGTAKAIAANRDLLDEDRQRSGPLILDVPIKSEVGSPPLFDQIQARWRKQMSPDEPDDGS
jgi:hypothetical protein